MKKEDILERSRRSIEDEGMRHAENQGRKIGYIAFTTLFAVLAILCLFFWQMNAFYAISALFWTHYAAEWFSKYRFTRRTDHLIGSICGGIAGVIFTIVFVMAISGLTV